MVLAAVIVSATMRVIAVFGSLSWVIVGMSVGIEGVACVMVVAKMLTHRDCGVLPTSLWFLVDRRIPTGVF